ncbi:hypothetical protein [Deinococcus hopiensis]|uniref:Uncharacterized protein n=1 Tax=Deinococcus hopiensis KR-140 TaxID=695939 RepID=A0A1W1VML4_9DEIO|nr:hypothetical protein [Deinococcus hopiensis]SMB94194.1 hypothetical protein SAMN00790413_02287 [Deinococcus hopiensis KR-140]
MTFPLPKGVALAVLRDVACAGALTSAAVTRQHGPRPAWKDLVPQGLLKSLLTARGEVLVLSAQGHAVLQDLGETHDRITGVERAVDRSFQNDALTLLQGLGYRVIHAHRQSGPLGHGRIVRYTIEVPPQQLAQLENDWPRSSPPPLPGQPFRESLGRPSVYATCSRGGRGRKAVQDLVERVHSYDIDTWRAPLLVFVPELAPDLRAYLRRHEAQRSKALDGHFGPGLIHGRPRYEALEVHVL